jgi:ATP-binding cassette, subfamily B, multidrug efflux pump
MPHSVQTIRPQRERTGVSSAAMAGMGAETPRYETSEQRQEARLAAIQNNFAGRIANRVMQTGPAIRETLVAMLTGVWYIMVYGATALILLASAQGLVPLFCL